VPFRPSGDKPVYCSDCFEKKGGRDGNRSRDRDGAARRSFGGRDSGGSARNGVSDQKIAQLSEKVETLNKKLDTIIGLLSAEGQESVMNKGKSKKKNKTDEEVVTTVSEEQLLSEERVDELSVAVVDEDKSEEKTKKEKKAAKSKKTAISGKALKEEESEIEEEADTL
jgi:hypothetical protein